MVSSKNKEVRLQQFTTLKDFFEANYSAWLKDNPAVIYSPDKKQITSSPSKVEFEQCYTLDPLNQQSGKTAVLIFGSQKNPGGGVTRGTVAQEEDVSLRTSWYFQVKGLTQYYSLRDKFSAINSDEIIFAKGLVISDEYHNFLSSPKDVYFIGGAAPNFTGLIDSIGIEEATKQLKDIENKMLTRIRKVLTCAEENKIDNLILGAWGCGVFGLSAEMVADKFYQAINENIYSGKIIFAIPDKKIEIFKNRFKIYPSLKP